jgi:hypothetical protein
VTAIERSLIGKEAQETQNLAPAILNLQFARMWRRAYDPESLILFPHRRREGNRKPNYYAKMTTRVQTVRTPDQGTFVNKSGFL